MKIYVAAPFCTRDTVAQGVVEALEAAGHEITSTWIESTREIGHATIGTSKGSSDEEARRHALMDISDIEGSDAVVMVSSEYAIIQGYDGPAEWLHTGGRHVEVGVALAAGKAVHILGEPENVFGRGLAFVHYDLNALLAWIDDPILTSL
jgi:nucleoside 2-deoxyribosyltransferase